MSLEYNLPIIKHSPILFKQHIPSLIPIKRKVSFVIKSEFNNSISASEISTSQSLNTKEHKFFNNIPCQSQTLKQVISQSDDRDNFMEQYLKRRQMIQQVSFNNCQSLQEEYELFKCINTTYDCQEQIQQLKQIIKSQTLELKGYFDKCEACNYIADQAQIQLNSLKESLMLLENQ
ncbi:Hypothetical_protein [Hexamita inflata]|uniref:Hypothetical_protein n=1 Tax=Hexamita inflata TaxID=28002 RepID=A0AA86N5G4_9EUKA|nr:Hypothetical protein HINF_LOCUS740 [Hexamita inflata]